METDMANTPKVLIIDAATGEETLRDMNAEELVQWESDQAAWLAEQAAIEADKQAKAEAKASAESKLTALGLTETEIAALRG